MNRRRLLTGLCILPFTETIRSNAAICAQSCLGGTKPFYVILEGPFLVVLNRQSAGSTNITGVTAFTPPDVQHQFKLNGVPFPSAANKYKFELNEQSGLTKYTTTCVDISLKDACVDKIPALTCNPDDAFIRIKLPCPQRIFTRNLGSVTFANGKTGFMPQDHVLEYQIASTNRVTMKYENLNQVVDAAPNNTFRFEVGLPPDTSPTVSAQHAKDFHNGSVLKCFKLESDQSRQVKSFPTAAAPAGAARASGQISILTTTLECKSGGLIGGTP